MDSCLQSLELQHDPEVRQLQERICQLGERVGHLPEEHPAKYPLKARVMMEKLCAIVQASAYDALDPSSKCKYAALADSFRDISANSAVIITGLVSEAGLRLNGSGGSARSFDAHTNRWVVVLPDGRALKIKPENLKTPWGIARTNGCSFDSEGTAGFYESFSRINHSCAPNVATA